jgi:hypothetical protein
MIILKLILKIGCEHADCVDLAQDRVQWRALVKTVTTFWFHKSRGISGLDK